MTILEENSKLLVESIKDLYKKGKYEISYAIVQLNKFYSNGRITQVDYEKQCEYYKAEKEKLNTVQVEEIEEQTENDEENIEENDTVDDTVEETENQEEVKGAK